MKRPLKLGEFGDLQVTASLPLSNTWDKSDFIQVYAKRRAPDKVICPRALSPITLVHKQRLPSGMRILNNSFETQTLFQAVDNEISNYYSRYRDSFVPEELLRELLKEEAKVQQVNKYYDKSKRIALVKSEEDSKELIAVPSGEGRSKIRGIPLECILDFQSPGIHCFNTVHNGNKKIIESTEFHSEIYQLATIEHLGRREKLSSMVSIRTDYSWGLLNFPSSKRVNVIEELLFDKRLAYIDSRIPQGSSDSQLESIISGEDGSIWLCNLREKPAIRELYKGTESHTFHQSIFHEVHPFCALNACNDHVSLLDWRQERTSTVEIQLMPLQKNEVITGIASLHRVSPYYFLVNTTLGFSIIDQRSPHLPVVSYEHQVLHPEYTIAPEISPLPILCAQHFDRNLLIKGDPFGQLEFYQYQEKSPPPKPKDHPKDSHPVPKDDLTLSGIPTGSLPFSLTSARPSHTSISLSSDQESNLLGNDYLISGLDFLIDPSPLSKHQPSMVLFQATHGDLDCIWAQRISLDLESTFSLGTSSSERTFSKISTSNIEQVIRDKVCTFNTPVLDFNLNLTKLAKLASNTNKKLQNSIETPENPTDLSAFILSNPTIEEQLKQFLEIPRSLREITLFIEKITKVLYPIDTIQHLLENQLKAFSYSISFSGSDSGFQTPLDKLSKLMYTKQEFWEFK